MSNTRLVWSTPSIQYLIAYCARVSNPLNQENTSTEGLLKYCMKHGHWSVFEMASMCVEIVTTRAISAQILRHKSFSFQEFSQRYAKSVNFVSQKARRQDDKNRQNSIDDLPASTQDWWDEAQDDLYNKSFNIYEQALAKGVAKECARMVLPLATETKLYMSGTIRSWIHYCQLRCADNTQLEHRQIANEIRELLIQHIPVLRELL